MCVRLVVHVPSCRVGDARKYWDCLSYSVKEVILDGRSCGGEHGWWDRVSLEGSGVEKAGRGRFLRGGGGVYVFRVRDGS